MQPEVALLIGVEVEKPTPLKVFMLNAGAQLQEGDTYWLQLFSSSNRRKKHATIQPMWGESVIFHERAFHRRLVDKRFASQIKHRTSLRYYLKHPALVREPLQGALRLPGSGP